MIDAHVHIDEYGEELPRALKLIRSRSIRTLAVSMDIPSFRRAQEIAGDEPLILPSFGIHPWNAPDYADRLDELRTPLNEAAAIGEIGLDHRFVDDENTYPAQQVVFSYFLDSAEQSGRLVNLHTSGAEVEILDHLRGRALPAIIIHWYNGPMTLVEEFLALGAYFTIGVEVLLSDTIRELASLLPSDRLLTETDNPGGWHWLKGEVGYPDLLGRVELEIAHVRGTDKSDLSDTVSRNFDNVLKAGGLVL